MRFCGSVGVNDDFLRCEPRHIYRGASFFGDALFSDPSMLGASKIYLNMMVHESGRFLC